MTTENTDAATRILTKTIRKLAEQLAEADESIRYEEGKREEAEGRLADIRKTLDPQPQPKGLNGFAESFSRVVGRLISGDYQSTEDLAAERMAELAEERDKRKCAEEGRRLAGDRMVDLEERIEAALAALDSDNSAVDRVDGAVVILRGEARPTIAPRPKRCWAT